MRSVAARAFTALTAVLFCSAFHCVQAQTSLQYQKPPQAIVDLVDTRPTPNVEVSPRDGTGTQWLLIESFSGLPTVADLGSPSSAWLGCASTPERMARAGDATSRP
jgi:hypothetical protein